MTEDSNAPSILLFEVHKQNLQWLKVKFKINYWEDFIHGSKET
jgi:hypothetical protein